MKNLIIGITLFCALLTASCHKNGLTTAKQTVIDGKIANFKNGPGNTNKFTLTVVDFGGNPTDYTANVKPDGTFTISFDQYIAQDVTIEPLIHSFIAHPGDHIRIDLDYSDIGNVKFGGDGEETNTDLIHYINEYYSKYDETNLKQFFHGLDTANYRATCENMHEDMLKTRKEFLDKYSPNDEVKNWTKNYVDIQYYTALISFCNAYNYLQLKSNPTSTTLLTKGYNINDKDIDQIYNTDLLNANSYPLLNHLMPRIPPKEYKNDFDATIKTEMPAIDRSYNNIILKQSLKAYLFYCTLLQEDVDLFDKNRSLFEDGVHISFIKKPLLKYYSAVKKDLANVQIRSNTILKNATGTLAKPMLDSIIIQNKGKVIYIDFWATWCGPCKAEMPYSKKLIERYKDKPVTFAFICLDSPKDAWKKNVADMGITGVQYYFDNDQSKSICKGLNINAIPHYMIINKDGDITESDVIGRPSQPMTINKIDKLLN
jgi:thiol-disulfide isomerase/thioredoxin